MHGREVAPRERAHDTNRPGAPARNGAVLTSRGYLDGLLLSAGGIMYVKGHPDGRFLLVNPAFEQLIGVSACDILGRTGHEIFPIDIADVHDVNDRSVGDTGIASTSRDQALDADGQLREYVTHKFPLLDPDGNVFAVGGISTDITVLERERQASQAAWQESETRFRTVFDHAPIGQIYADMQGVITSVNEPMAAMLGWSADELVGQSVQTLVADDELERVLETTRALLTGRARSVSAIRRYTCRDGGQVPVRVTSALLRCESGEPRWWVSMVVDIAEEERTRVELERAHAELQTSARRMRLLHAIATAANDSASIEDLGPEVLELICAHFAWPAGALVELTGAGNRVTAERARETATPEVREQLTRVAGAAVHDHNHRNVSVCDGFVLVPVCGEGGQCWAWVFVRGDTIVTDDQREVLSLIGIETARVVERGATRQRLQNSEERFRLVFAASPLPMGLTLGNTGTYSAVNAALCRLLGRTPAELIGLSARSIVHPDDVKLTDPAGAAAMAAPDSQHRVELRLMHSSGDVVTAIVTLTWMDSADGSRHLLAQMEDITARRRAEEDLRRQAEEDMLTGLANRARLGRALRDLAENEAFCAVLFVDVDGFKLINDTRGHDVGDEVLREVAARLRSAVRPADLVARFGGDEFVVLCQSGSGTMDTDAARRIADRAQSLLSLPIATQAGLVSLTASIGIANGPVEQEHPQDLIRRADLAMYHAKLLGKDRWEVYDANLHERALAYQRTEAALRNALAEDRFVLHYQPIVELRDSTIVGFEALVRLVDEAGQLVGPDKFIRVAEQSGLIVAMGNWVLHEACRTIAEQRRRTGLPLVVSVNVAARQVARPDFVDTVDAALAATGLPENALALELTETALLEANSSTLEQLTHLRERGVQIALDDFGTGYSSLTYLRTFPVSHLKVDRSFVSGVTCVAGDLAIVRAVTALADELGMSWVAEGIETAEQRAALIALGRGLGQGYFYSRPVSKQELPAMLAQGFGPRLLRGA